MCRSLLEEMNSRFHPTRGFYRKWSFSFFRFILAVLKLTKCWDVRHFLDSHTKEMRDSFVMDSPFC